MFDIISFKKFNEIVENCDYVAYIGDKNIANVLGLEYNKGNINIIVKRKENNKKYLLHERRYNGLNRHFYFKDFDGDNINAKYENGVLIISIPKKEIKCNKIEIK